MPGTDTHFTFTVELTEDETDGGWVARCPELPGCYSQGETEHEATDNIVDAITGVLAVRLRREVAAKTERHAREHKHSGRATSCSLDLAV